MAELRLVLVLAPFVVRCGSPDTPAVALGLLYTTNTILGAAIAVVVCGSSTERVFGCKPFTRVAISSFAAITPVVAIVVATVADVATIFVGVAVRRLFATC